MIYFSGTASFNPDVAPGFNVTVQAQKGFVLKYANIQMFKLTSGTRYVDGFIYLGAILNGKYVALNQSVNLGGGPFAYLFPLPVFETTYPYLKIPTFDTLQFNFAHGGVVGESLTYSFTFGGEYE